MHPISFSLKRGHLRAVAFGKQALVKVKDMTPARFDLMYALRQVGVMFERVATFGEKSFTGMQQSELWKMLGLSRSAVSTMLIRLEEMGWLTRTPDPSDRRTKFIRLTDAGRSRIKRAMSRIFQTRVILKSYEDLFSPRRKNPSILTLLESIWHNNQAIARNFGDTSALIYEMGCVPD